MYCKKKKWAHVHGRVLVGVYWSRCRWTFARVCGHVCGQVCRHACTNLYRHVVGHCPMCVGILLGMCADMCVHMCTDMCVDMCINIVARHRSPCVPLRSDDDIASAYAQLMCISVEALK